MRSLRTLWLAALGVEVGALIAAGWLAEGDLLGLSSGRGAGATLFLVAVALDTLILAGGWLGRSALFGRQHNGAVEPLAYARGSLALYAACLTAVVVAASLIVLTGRLMPLLLVGLVAVVVQAIAYPTGGVLRQRRVGARRRTPARAVPVEH